MVSIAKSVGVLDLVELEAAVDRLLDVSGALDRVAVGVEADGAGDRVDGQRPLAVIHAKDENSWQEAAKAVKAAIKLDDKAPEITPTVYRRITE